MATELKNGDQYIKSNLPAENSRGRNGDPTPSSVTKAPPPIAKVSPSQVTVPDSNWQSRSVNASPIAPAHGMLHRQMHRKLK
jgi:hypothetical protein